jgi:hypothetical protein
MNDLLLASADRLGPHAPFWQNEARKPNDYSAPNFQAPECVGASSGNPALIADGHFGRTKPNEKTARISVAGFFCA